MKPRWSTVRSLSLYLFLLTLALPALANEVTVKNDSYVNGGSVYVVGDFVPREQAGARLTAPCNGSIVAVQTAWIEGTPGHNATIEQAIHIFDGSTFPTPGPELAFLDAPLMTPGYFNEFRYLDEQHTVPLNVPVVSGQQFYVTLEFANATDVGNGGPSVARDLDGCQAGKNVLYAIPGGWMNFCIYLQGDLLIRAVINCGGAATGACCLADGTCQVKTAAQCTSAGGTYQGDNTNCANVNCPQPSGACCIERTHGCLNLTHADCNTVGGIWGGAGTNCATYVCFPIGACCLPDGSCQGNQSPAQCTALGGTFQGNGTTCGTVNCPPPTGACCLGNGNCIVFTAADCAVVAGTWAGPGTNCADNNGNGKADACESPPHPGDMNCDGVVNFADIDPFVLALTDQAAYQAQYPNCRYLNGDCNNDGSVGFDDIDPFVALLGG